MLRKVDYINLIQNTIYNPKYSVIDTETKYWKIHEYQNKNKATYDCNIVQEVSKKFYSLQYEPLQTRKYKKGEGPELSSHLFWNLALLLILQIAFFPYVTLLPHFLSFLILHGFTITYAYIFFLFQDWGIWDK